VGEKHGLSYEEVIAGAHGRPSIETIRVMAPHLNASQEAANHEAYECSDLDGVYPIEGAANEDSPNGLNAALAAGMQCLAVATTHSADQLAKAHYLANTLKHVAVADSSNGQIVLEITT